MGLNQSQDLSARNDIVFDQKQLLLTIKPYYLLSSGETEFNLDTSNQQLNDLINQRLNQWGPQIFNVLLNTSHMESPCIIWHQGYYYVTVRHLSGRSLTLQDCHTLRQIIQLKIGDVIILHANESQKSHFFEDWGDISIGLSIQQIDYL